jgi:hypothetical protein
MVVEAMGDVALAAEKALALYMKSFQGLNICPVAFGYPAPQLIDAGGRGFDLTKMADLDRGWRNRNTLSQSHRPLNLHRGYTMVTTGNKRWM